jgi:hypothetical protein
MTTINNAGGEGFIKVVPTAGINIPGAVVKDTAGVARDLTNAVIKLHLSDGDNYSDRSQNSTTTYTQTITDAANGVFTLAAPASYFENKWGEEVTFSLTLEDNGGSPEAMAYGTVQIVDQA